MSSQLSVDPAPAPVQFSIGGRVTAWDPIARRLQMGLRTFWVAPSVSATRLARGVRGALMGHIEQTGSSATRWWVTDITLD